MPRNIEIKARIPSVDALEPIAASLAIQGPTEIAQDDIFFCCKSGRLKLRMSCESGAREARALMGRLGIEPSDLIETAYVDLLAQSAARLHEP